MAPPVLEAPLVGEADLLVVASGRCEPLTSERGASPRRAAQSPRLLPVRSAPRTATIETPDSRAPVASSCPQESRPLRVALEAGCLTRSFHEGTGAMILSSTSVAERST